MATTNDQLAQMLNDQTARSAAIALPPALPSASSALAFANGQPGALPLVVFHTVLRAGIIGAGLYVAGQRRSLVKNAIVSSVAIEAFVLGWAVWKSNQPPLLPST